MKQIAKDKLVKGTIEEINSIRKQHKLRPIKKIHKWKNVSPYRSINCPVAQTFSVGTDENASCGAGSVRFGTSIYPFKAGGPLYRFLEAFDGGEFPEYGGPPLD